MKWVYAYAIEKALLSLFTLFQRNDVARFFISETCASYRNHEPWIEARGEQSCNERYTRRLE